MTDQIAKQIYATQILLISHTAYTTQMLVSEFDVPAEKVFQVALGTVGENYTLVPKKEARAALGMDLNAPVVVFFGAMRKDKGLEYLIRAFPSVIEVFRARSSSS